jgi:hypothetical protein
MFGDWIDLFFLGMKKLKRRRINGYSERMGGIMIWHK